MSCENRLWGTERIRGELLKLGIVVSNRSIRRHRWRGPMRPPSQNWRPLLANHAHHLWAADFLTVPTLTFKTLYVLVFIAHHSRALVHVNVTANPTAAWVWRPLIEATPWGRQPRHLLRDRDAVYGHDCRARADRMGIDAIATPIRAPKANAVAERVIGRSAENVSITSACSTNSISPRSSRSSSTMTTPSGRIGHCVWRRRSHESVRPAARCVRAPCSMAYTTSLSALPERARLRYCPPTGAVQRPDLALPGWGRRSSLAPEADHGGAAEGGEGRQVARRELEHL